MRKLLSREIIEEAALETGIASSFIEKDWYAVQLLALIHTYNSTEDIQPIFGGGTSLSKGYQLIKRFSEDLDFILATPNNDPLTSTKRKAFRVNLIEHISGSSQLFTINRGQIIRGDNYRFFKTPVTYPKHFEGSTLRPHLQLEMLFTSANTKPEIRPIQSIINKLTGKPPETNILCTPPLQTAANKLSAFTWRMLSRNRQDSKDDPTIVRHLYDLAALKDTVFNNPKEFKSLAQESFNQDQTRPKDPSIAELTSTNRLSQTLKTLKEDKAYQKEYENFALAMCYDNPNERIQFSQPVKVFESIAEIYWSE